MGMRRVFALALGAGMAMGFVAHAMASEAEGKTPWAGFNTPYSTDGTADDRVFSFQLWAGSKHFDDIAWLQRTQMYTGPIVEVGFVQVGTTKGIRIDIEYARAADANVAFQVVDRPDRPGLRGGKRLSIPYAWQDGVQYDIAVTPLTASDAVLVAIRDLSGGSTPVLATVVLPYTYVGGFTYGSDARVVVGGPQGDRCETIPYANARMRASNALGVGRVSFTTTNGPFPNECTRFRELGAIPGVNVGSSATPTQDGTGLDMQVGIGQMDTP